MATKNIQVDVNGKGLAGVLHVPNQNENNKVPVIIFVHGFVGSKVGEHRLFVKAARYFVDHGYAVLRFDFSGCGESDGDYGEVTLTNQINELKAMIDVATNESLLDGDQITVIGHSLGGAVSALTSAQDQRIQRLMLWSPVARPYEDITRITGKQAVRVAKRVGSFDYLGFSLRHEFFADLKKHAPLVAIRSYHGPVGVIHADDDEQVPKTNAADYVKALEQGRTESVIKDYIATADHTFSGYSYENELFSKSLAWLRQTTTTLTR
ncbi:alpha/beta hydrolase family protein [Desertibacillus haloalkaliphilus]|uniref:alpha/beta hydrolase family protein n=1 Tax=Desertibacillus haloalkaliphilus TaxID=1328930 RepID=UPI001C27E59C|nr:alpha/beta fold hydrolase [Desertibacillus haloalkaliphilus]MBU8908009.1 alpha/beta hydrolase [Desertibacillus haloalkaliphilus]